jgi:hypothetical protein
MINFLGITFLFISLTFSLNGAGCHPSWQKKDKALILELVSLDFSDPKAITTFFDEGNSNNGGVLNENLGFGWMKTNKVRHGGYISLMATFFYYQKNVVSYTIYAELPKQKLLIKKYIKWYGNMFKETNSHLIPYSFNMSELVKPVVYYAGGYTCDSLSPQAKYFMAPCCLEPYQAKRVEFFKVCDQFTTEEISLLMFSKNPSTRFCAIEYYLRNKEKFTDQEQIEAWMKKCFQQNPFVRIHEGCFLDYESSEETVFKFAKTSK